MDVLNVEDALGGSVTRHGTSVLLREVDRASWCSELYKMV